MKQSAIAYNSVPLWEPVAFLPCQMADRTGRAHWPELRLVAAMLEDALQCVLRNATAVSGPRRREFLEAYDWLWDDSREWPFTFANVCDLLGLDDVAVRQCIRLIIATQRSCADDRHDKTPDPPGGTTGSWKKEAVPGSRSGPDQSADWEHLDVVVWDEV
jgi:hypothetical protein